MMDKVRVLRIIEYVGDRNMVEDTVEKSIQGTKQISPLLSIKAATIGSYPEILETTEQSKVDDSISVEDLPLIEWIKDWQKKTGIDYGENK
jgi:hypothetical protein